MIIVFLTHVADHAHEIIPDAETKNYLLNLPERFPWWYESDAESWCGCCQESPFVGVSESVSSLTPTRQIWQAKLRLQSTTLHSHPCPCALLSNSQRMSTLRTRNVHGLNRVLFKFVWVGFSFWANACFAKTRRKTNQTDQDQMHAFFLLARISVRRCHLIWIQIHPK